MIKPPHILSASSNEKLTIIQSIVDAVETQFRDKSQSTARPHAGGDDNLLGCHARPTDAAEKPVQ
jgi:hypothetical protein